MSQSQPKKVLIFSLTYYPKYVGGAEVAIKEITDRIAPGDIAFDMITLRFDSALPEEERIGNVMVYRIGPTKKDPQMDELVRFPMYLIKVLYPLLAAWKAFRLNQEKHYDGAWAMMSYMGFPIIILRAFFFTKLPYVLTLQEGDSIEHVTKRWRIRIVHFLYAPVYRLPRIVQTISTYLADWARAMGYKGELVVVPNAVDTAYFSREFSDKELNVLRERLGKKAGERFIITTSRLVAKNAVDIVIRSLEYLPETVKFLVLGVGPDEAKLRKLATGLGLSRRVLFLGHIDRMEMPKYLKVSDVFVRPSRSEGMGISFVEAMAAGIPVVATAIGGITDFLFDPKQNPDKEPTGFFVNVEDPKDTARAIKEFLEDETLRERCVENAKRMVKGEYDWNLIAKNMREKVFAALFLPAIQGERRPKVSPWF
ncbi:MAG: glycosyltransferase family 4 protein [bacterium]|nr:glycosyltransferase family 4 protein [bacterium]